MLTAPAETCSGRNGPYLNAAFRSALFLFLEQGHLSPAAFCLCALKFEPITTAAPGIATLRTDMSREDMRVLQSIIVDPGELQTMLREGKGAVTVEATVSSLRPYHLSSAATDK